MPSTLSVKHLWLIVVRALELAGGWSDVEEGNRAARRAAALEKEVLRNVPVNCRLLADEKVSLRDLWSKCKDSSAYNRVKVNEVVQALERIGGTTKAGSHSYYNCEKVGHDMRPRWTAATELPH